MSDASTPRETVPSGIADDWRLLVRARDGDELAFRRLLRRHNGLFETIANRFYLPGGDRDDVLQEARIGFSKAVAAYRRDRNSSFRAFASMCVTRQVATALTNARRHKQQPLTGSVRGEQSERACAGVVDATTPLDRVLMQERLDGLAQGCRRLSSLERAAVTRTAAGYSYEEATRELDVSRKAYDNALQRARRKLRVHDQPVAA